MSLESLQNKFVKQVWSKDGLYYPSDSIKLLYADSIIKKILSYGEFKTAIDVGCGTGLYIQTLLENGVKAIGLEGNKKSLDECKTNIDKITLIDLEEWVSKDFFDLVISIEVAEHLSSINASKFAKQLSCTTKSMLFFTASDLSGPEHLNPQPEEYWIKKMEENSNIKYNKDLSWDFMQFASKLIANNHGCVWFKKNVMIFNKI